MEKENNKIIIMYISLLIVFLISSIIIAVFLIPKYFQEYARIANLLVWIGLFIVTRPMENEKVTIKSKRNRIRTILLIVIVGYLMYFASGILVGYRVNPYSRNILRILINIGYVTGIVLTKQYIRDKLVNNKKRISIYVIITIIFAITELSFKDLLASFGSAQTVFEFMCGELLPEIIKSAVCTYLVVEGGFQVAYAYRLPIEIAEVLLPIIPDFDWFAMAGFEIILAITVAIYNSYENVTRAKRLTRKEIRKASPVRNIPIVILLIILIAFIAGVLPYKPVAVMSNSMRPVFERGAVVITKKIDKDYQQINVGDILEYRTSRGTIIHRIVRIEVQKDGTYIYVTKGDNNDSEDSNVVYENQVLGIVKVSIPYIGYPAVLFSENVLKRESHITN